MKNEWLFIVLISNLSIFSQGEPNSTFNYKTKFEGVSDASKAAPIITAMKMVFKTPAIFNETTGLIEFTSKMSISQTVFNHMMAGEGFQMESFERQEIKQESSIETKKVSTVDTTFKSKIAIVKKDVPKNESIKK